MFAIVIPTGSDHDRTRRPLATLSLIGFNLLVYLLSNLGNHEHITRKLGLVAAHPLPHQFLTHMFLHAGWPTNFDLDWYFFTLPILILFLHMLFLWFTGSDLEDALGPARFLAVYLVGGIAAGLLAWTVAAVGQFPAQDQPIIGSAGGISALLGLYLVRFPRFKVRVWYGILVLIPSVARQGIVRITSVLFIALYMLLQFIDALLSVQAGGAYVAGWGNLGSFLLGLGFGLATKQSQHGKQEYLLKEADYLFYRQKWHAALELYKQAAERNQRCTEAFIKWALCWECSGMWKRAEKVLSDALGLYAQQGWAAEAAAIQKELSSMIGKSERAETEQSEQGPASEHAPAAQAPAPPNLLFRKELKWKGKSR